MSKKHTHPKMGLHPTAENRLMGEGEVLIVELECRLMQKHGHVYF